MTYMLIIYIGMLDPSQVQGFQWDEGNGRKSANKHGVAQGEAEQVFFNAPVLLLPDPQHSSTESRYHALGRTDEHRLLHVTFALRQKGQLIRVISARDANRKERARYEKQA